MFVNEEEITKMPIILSSKYSVNNKLLIKHFSILIFFLAIVIIFSSSISADVISVNAGGSGASGFKLVARYGVS